MVLRLERILPVIKAVRARKSFRAAQLSRFKRASAILLDGFDSQRVAGRAKRLIGRLRGGRNRTGEFSWRAG